MTGKQGDSGPDLVGAWGLGFLGIASPAPRLLMSWQLTQNPFGRRRVTALLAGSMLVVLATMVGGAAASGTSSVVRAPGGLGAPPSAAFPVGMPQFVAPHPNHELLSGSSPEADPTQGPAAPGSAAPASAAASPGCGSSPCPMGITDYGVNPSGGSYSYLASDVESFVDIGSIGISGTVSGCGDPYATWCMGFQSNWVDTNVMVNNHAHVYWVQNVAQVSYDKSCSSPCVSGTYSVAWLDNIWNFSGTGCVKS